MERKCQENREKCEFPALQGKIAALRCSTTHERMDKEVKRQTIEEFRRHETDTGSAVVQIAVLSRRIKHLEGHCVANRKDNNSRRGLITMVERRKQLLKYLHREDADRFTQVKKELGIR